jgi:excisionase family DNA binding protein
MDEQTNHTYLTRNEAARYLRIGTATLDNLVAAGEIPSVKLGGRRLFRIADVDARLDELATVAR